jgi:hypothetical protein
MLFAAYPTLSLGSYMSKAVFYHAMVVSMKEDNFMSELNILDNSGRNLIRIQDGVVQIIILCGKVW